MVTTSNSHDLTGHQAMATIWALVALVLLFLLLRIYTRFKYVSAYGADDYAYFAAFILLALSAGLLQGAVAAGYGALQRAPDAELALPTRQRIRLSVLRLVGVCLIVLATMGAKCSVGLFLLRLVVEQWHRVLIWCCLGICVTFSLVSSFLFMLGCKPISASWDHAVQGSCIDTRPLNMIWGRTILLDLIFAILPWIFIWSLSKPPREKILIAGSLSLGIIAAAAGAVRLAYLATTTPSGAISLDAVVCSAAEIAATLVAVGVPASLPVFRRLLSIAARHHHDGDDNNNNNNNNMMQEALSTEQPMVQFTIGGGRMPGSKPARESVLVDLEAFQRQRQQQQQQEQQEEVVCWEKVAFRPRGDVAADYRRRSFLV